MQAHRTSSDYREILNLYLELMAHHLKYLRIGNLYQI